MANHQMKDWEIIADNLSKAGWNCGCISALARVFFAHYQATGNLPPCKALLEAICNGEFDFQFFSRGQSVKTRFVRLAIKGQILKRNDRRDFVAKVYGAKWAGGKAWRELKAGTIGSSSGNRGERCYDRSRVRSRVIG